MEKFDSRAQAAYVAALFCGVECLMSGRASTNSLLLKMAMEIVSFPIMGIVHTNNS